MCLSDTEGAIRVGLEDNRFLAEGELSPGNAPLVERACTIVNSLGCSVATPTWASSACRGPVEGYRRVIEDLLRLQYREDDIRKLVGRNAAALL